MNQNIEETKVTICLSIKEWDIIINTLYEMKHIRSFVAKTSKSRSMEEIINKIAPQTEEAKMLAMMSKWDEDSLAEV